MTALPNPFLNSAEFSSFSVVAAASGGLPLQNAAAEISSAEPLSAGPAGSLVPAPQAPAGTIPLDYETILKALESCLHEDWIFGIDEPDPLVFLETFRLGEVA